MNAISEIDAPPIEALTFGCRLNSAESDQMLAAATAAGESDLLIVNSCAVTAEATRQTIRAIRRAKREKPDRRIFVTGCAVETETARFTALSEIDRIIPNAEKLRVWAPAAGPLAGFRTHTRSFVDIQTGCDHRCTFCIIPYGRGPSRSRPPGEILAKVAALVEDGRKEIVLTGVDLTSWGADLHEPVSLGTLVREILKANPALPRLRLSSLDCLEIDPVLQDAIAHEPRLMPHYHLSLQSGSDLILKRMRRRHRREDSIRICRQILAARPEASLGADLIVGFPTETEAMFEETLSLAEACGLSFLHVFPFSPRPGVPASRMPQVPGEIVRDRAGRLRRQGEEIYARRLRGFAGRTVEVLVEQGDAGHAKDFTRVLLPRGLIRGTIQEVLITGSTERELIGSLSGRQPQASSRASM